MSFPSSSGCVARISSSETFANCFSGMVPFQVALTAVFVEGFVFVGLTILGIRQWLARYVHILVLQISFGVINSCASFAPRRDSVPLGPHRQPLRHTSLSTETTLILFCTELSRLVSSLRQVSELDFTSQSLDLRTRLVSVLSPVAWRLPSSLQDARTDTRTSMAFAPEVTGCATRPCGSVSSVVVF